MDELDRQEHIVVGESVCWLDRVCDDCGALVEAKVPAVCWRCGAIVVEGDVLARGVAVDGDPAPR